MKCFTQNRLHWINTSNSDNMEFKFKEPHKETRESMAKVASGENPYLNDRHNSFEKNCQQKVKEIIDNKFGTPTPVMYDDWSHAIPNQMTGELLPLSVNIKCFGSYTFKLTDPATFMREIAGMSEVYKKEQLLEQMRSEVQAAFQNVLNALGNSEHKVPVLELPSQTTEIKKLMDENVFDEPIRKRGISLVSFIVESLTLIFLLVKLFKYLYINTLYAPFIAPCIINNNIINGAAFSENIFANIPIIIHEKT